MPCVSTPAHRTICSVIVCSRPTRTATMQIFRFSISLASPFGPWIRGSRSGLPGGSHRPIADDAGTLHDAHVGVVVAQCVVLHDPVVPKGHLV